MHTWITRFSSMRGVWGRAPANDYPGLEVNIDEIIFLLHNLNYNKYPVA